jgi:hypothetical protein
MQNLGLIFRRPYWYLYSLNQIIFRFSLKSNVLHFVNFMKNNNYHKK